VDVRLTRVKPGTVVATVIDITGRPVTGATVKVFSPGERGKTLGSGVTDSTGRAAIEGIVEKFVQLRASKTGYIQVVTRDHPQEGPMAYPAQPAWTHVEPGERSEARIELSPVGSLRGIVRNAGGEPLAGVKVSSSEELGKTGKDGKFAVDGVPRDLPSFVAFEAEGYLTIRQVVRPGVTVEVVLPRGRAVTGVVVDESDRPVAGVRVTARDPEKEWTHASSGATGADGAFRVDGIGVDEVVLRAHRRGWPQASSAMISLDEGQTREGIRIRMARGVEVRLTFEDADGKDTDASFALYGPLDRPPAERLNLQRRRRSGSDPAQHRIIPGRYRILATPSADASGGALEIEREIREDVEILLTFSGEARRIRLETPAESRPIGATLSRTDPELPRIRLWITATGEGRRIESAALPPGRYAVRVYFREESGEGFRTQILEDLEPGGKPVTVRPPGD
jgi:carboxypeptidase family protein